MTTNISVESCVNIIRDNAVNHTAGQQVTLVIFGVVALTFFYMWLFTYINKKRAHRFIINKKLSQEYDDWLDKRRKDEN